MGWEICIILIMCHTGSETGAARDRETASAQFVPIRGSFWLNCSRHKDADLLTVRFGRQMTKDRTIPLFKQMESVNGPPRIIVHSFDETRLQSVDWGTVHVSDAKPEDSGVYTCTEEKTIGEDLTVEMEITSVHVLVPPPSPLASSMKYTFKTGEPIRLKCSARTSYLGPYEFTWSKVNESINLTKHRVDRFSGLLELEHPTLDDSGSYFCTLTTLAGISTSNIITITIKPLQKRPRVEIIPSPVSAGGNVVFKCMTSENHTEVVIYGWQKVGGDLDGFRFRLDSRSGVLTLTGAQPGDSGRYICSVTSDAGTTISTPASLVVQYLRVKIQKTIPVILQEDFQIACFGQGAPVNISFSHWLHEGPKGRKWYRGQDVGNGKSILTLRRVSRENNGVYTCTAENAALNASDSITLIVGKGDTFAPWWVVGGVIVIMVIGLLFIILCRRTKSGKIDDFQGEQNSCGLSEENPSSLKSYEEIQSEENLGLYEEPVCQKQTMSEVDKIQVTKHPYVEVHSAQGIVGEWYQNAPTEGCRMCVSAPVLRQTNHVFYENGSYETLGERKGKDYTRLILDKADIYAY